jgi:DNA polymerase III subunit epsilon
MPRRQREVPLAARISDADREAHRAFVATLGDKPIWNDFLPPPAPASAEANPA